MTNQVIPAEAVEAAETRIRAMLLRVESGGDALGIAVAALEAAAPYMLAEEAAPGMSREEVHADLERVRAVRDSFDPGSTVWLVNQSMAIAYESVLGITDEGATK